ncbi:MAG: dihydrolipoyl dehydrogenase [Gammaproteobacteria bacterium]
MNKSYDVVVIGGGPAGYVAAIRCTQLGLHTACVDDRVNAKGEPVLGGCCLNIGCIPSKALLDSSEQYEKLEHRFAGHGINVGKVSVDVPAMQARKERIVERLTKGIETLFRANKVEWLQGYGRLIDGSHVEITAVSGNGDKSVVEASHIILACGSQPIDIDAAPLDGTHIVDSTGALEFQEVPATLGIVGAGAIGLELGSVWRRLGSKVVLLEAMEDFLCIVDQQVAKQAYKMFKDQGLDIHLGTRVVSTRKEGKGITICYRERDTEHEIQVARLIVAAGRRPNLNSTIAPETELVVDEGGDIHVDEFCRTTVPNVYAIGDAVRGPMLAHKGSEEGIAVAEMIAGQKSQVNYEIIPNVIYTLPEIAWVGHTEQELKSSGIPYRTGHFPFAANGRAQAMEETTGMVKLIAHADTDQILGVHIIGACASELIAEAVLAMEYSASAEDLARTVHAHPTLSEALHEAALDIDRRAIHKANL